MSDLKIDCIKYDGWILNNEKKMFTGKYFCLGFTKFGCCRDDPKGINECSSKRDGWGIIFLANYLFGGLQDLFEIFKMQ